jgi:hypothetical protein
MEEQDNPAFDILMAALEVAVRKQLEAEHAKAVLLNTTKEVRN